MLPGREAAAAGTDGSPIRDAQRKRGTALARAERMNRGLYTVASGGMAALARLESVTQNLANVGTPGYKAERVLFRVRPLGREQLDPVRDATAAQVVKAEKVHDFEPGLM